MNKLQCRSSLTSSSWSSSSWLLIDHYYSVLRLVRRIPRTLCSSVHNIDKYIQSKRIQLNFQPNHDPHFTVHVHLPFVTLYWLGECQPCPLITLLLLLKGARMIRIILVLRLRYHHHHSRRRRQWGGTHPVVVILIIMNGPHLELMWITAFDGHLTYSSV